MKPNLLLFLTGLLISSCATLNNPRTTVLKIITSEPARLIINEDTISAPNQKRYVAVERSRDSLHLTAFNTYKSKSVSIAPRNSIAWWGNLYPGLWPGFLIDRNNPKRYTYPQTVYLDLNEHRKEYKTYRPVDAVFSRYNNIVKINPLKAVSPIAAGLEIGLEKRMSNSFTTQLTGTYLFRNPVWRFADEIDHQIKGFQGSIEQRYYFKRSAFQGPYLALDFSYLKTQFKDNWLFVDSESFVDSTLEYKTYTDTFGIKKQTYSLNVKYGYQFVIKRLTIDMNIGLGVRYKDILHFDRMKPEDMPESSNEPDFYQLSNESGKRWTASFPVSIRMGWSF